MAPVWHGSCYSNAVGLPATNSSAMHVAHRSEGVNEPGVPERAAQARPIKAQTTAVAPAAARICSAEGACLRGTSGHGGFVHTFSASRLRRGALVGAVLAWAASTLPAWAQDSRPRLRFKGRGSVCLCDDAMDEETIARAERPRAAAANSPASAPARGERASTPQVAASAAKPPAKPPQEQRP